MVTGILRVVVLLNTVTMVTGIFTCCSVTYHCYHGEWSLAFLRVVVLLITVTMVTGIFTCCSVTYHCYHGYRHFYML